jgi:hypothetical protein
VRPRPLRLPPRRRLRRSGQSCGSVTSRCERRRPSGAQINLGKMHPVDVVVAAVRADVAPMAQERLQGERMWRTPVVAAVGLENVRATRHRVH